MQDCHIGTQNGILAKCQSVGACFKQYQQPCDTGLVGSKSGMQKDETEEVNSKYKLTLSSNVRVSVGILLEMFEQSLGNWFVVETDEMKEEFMCGESISENSLTFTYSLGKPLSEPPNLKVLWLWFSKLETHRFSGYIFMWAKY